MKVRLAASVSAVAVVAAAYIAYPYATLYRMGDAVRRGDAAALASHVDWKLVRAGCAEDLSAAIQHTKNDALPPFGASFASGIATHAVKADLTPRTLLTALDSARSQSGPAVLEKAYFAGPALFMAVLRLPENTRLRIEMRLIQGDWKLTRVWLPEKLLQQAQNGT